MTLNETVFEMHFHRPLIDLFRRECGLGKNKDINFCKYSPQKEVFIGFDQAYAMSEKNDDEFYQELREAAMNRGYRLRTTYIAYFLQFKVVSRLMRRYAKTPPQISSNPHFRSALDTTRNERTGFSQHELLFDLNRNEKAFVYYACPMIFEKADLYTPTVDLGLLRLADLSTCPSSYSDNEKHYIYFENPDADPIWCSDPVAGSALSPMDLVELMLAELSAASQEESASQVLKILEYVRAYGSDREGMRNSSSEKHAGLRSVADTLTILRLQDQHRDE
jgi:hypothetical protein